MDIKGYERALGSLDKKKFKEAKTAFMKLAEKTDNAQFREKCNSHVQYCDRKLKEPETEKSFDPFARAIFLFNEKQFEEALALLQPLLKKDPKNDVLLYAIAAAKAGKGEEQKAINFLKKAIALNPANKLHAERDEIFAELQENLTKS
ncbi:MAG: hypothetical protein DRJ14_03345 [Acidobacteria bacterium]|nr:MAG: hypothetical protein DRJ14_03345 [Acidobacteriota bacterium]